MWFDRRLLAVAAISVWPLAARAAEPVDVALVLVHRRVAQHR